MVEQKRLNAILLLYHDQLINSAKTIEEHVESFCKHSRYNVLKINTALGFPKNLHKFKFSSIILHYSLFILPIQLNKKFRDYIQSSDDSYKIAFLQDEHRYWNERSDILNRCQVDCVYTLIEPEFFDITYKAKCPKISELIYTIPGYVGSDARKIKQTYFIPEEFRTVDIGYRARRLPYYMGKGSQEKHYIGVEFKKRAENYGLKMDIETDEERRIYGKAWPRFIANCKAVLGVEAGVSVFDMDGSIRRQYAAMCDGHPDVSFPECSFKEFHDMFLSPYEEKIYYRTISPRHFEAATLKVCQILFEGKYSGIMKPMVHYIPLKKDFSNFDDVIIMFKDVSLRMEIANNAYKDLIESKKFTYKNFIDEFDQNLEKIGIKPERKLSTLDELENILRTQKRNYLFYRYWASIRYAQFPGRDYLKPLIKPILKKMGI